MIMQMLLNGSHLHPFLNRPDKPIAQLLMALLGASGADFPPVLARNDSGEIYNEDRRRNHLISPCTHTHARTHDHTLSPDKTPALLSQTPALYPAGTHNNAHKLESFFPDTICASFLCLNTIAGDGVGRKREAAILELLLHRQ